MCFAWVDQKKSIATIWPFGARMFFVFWQIPVHLMCGQVEISREKKSHLYICGVIVRSIGLVFLFGHSIRSEWCYLATIIVFSLSLNHKCNEHNGFSFFFVSYFVHKRGKTKLYINDSVHVSLVRWRYQLYVIASITLLQCWACRMPIPI